MVVIKSFLGTASFVRSFQTGNLFASIHTRATLNFANDDYNALPKLHAMHNAAVHLHLLGASIC